jgi:hypothetical protein
MHVIKDGAEQRDEDAHELGVRWALSLKLLAKRW